MPPFDPIATERLLIRPYTAEDTAAAQVFLADAKTMAFWPRPFTPDEAAAWVARSVASLAETIYGRCVVILKTTGTVIGDVGVIRAELAGEQRDDLGYIIHWPYWRQGFATEAAGALRDYYFRELGREVLYANMPTDHIGSWRVAERLGMRRLLEYENPRNRNLPTYLYRIERADWKALATIP
jgi:[ribosomal protein S5]-alanine N-acetyltransferase